MARLGFQYSSEGLSGPTADAGLVEAAGRGDQFAFARLYERYAGVIHGLLLAKIPREDADDLVQEVFLIAMRRISTLRDPSSFAGWLSAIARNLAKDHYRSLKPTEPLMEEPPETVGWTIASRHPDAAIAEEILEQIRRLPDAYSETLILRLVEGLTGPEIAARTGLTHGSVRVNLCRGMRMLRDRLVTLGASRLERDSH